MAEFEKDFRNAIRRSDSMSSMRRVVTSALSHVSTYAEQENLSEDEVVERLRKVLSKELKKARTRKSDLEDVYETREARRASGEMPDTTFHKRVDASNKRRLLAEEDASLGRLRHALATLAGWDGDSSSASSSYDSSDADEYSYGGSSSSSSGAYSSSSS